MGIVDRDWYQEHWAEKFLGAKPKHKPFSDSTRGPIYVSDTGTASRSIDADPRLGAVYRQRRENARIWRVIWTRVALVLLGFLIGAALWKLRR